MSFAAVCVCCAGNATAASVFIDSTLKTDCSSGGYSIASRDCNGADGFAYGDLGTAIGAMSPGDHLILRGGTYVGCWKLPTSKNGTAWTAGNYNKISSCGTEEGCPTNEWAVLDGNGDCSSNGGAVLGHRVSTETGESDLKYWWLERLEIMNGRNATGTSGYGFNGNGGPFKIRYCYFHDNGGTPGTTSQCNDLPGGTSGQAWHDSVVEFNWYADNGGTAANNNCKQITWIPSYALTDDVEVNGLTVTNGHMGNGAYVLDVNNVIRYNYVTGGRVGIGVKHFVWLTGRNPGNSAGYDDTYAELSIKIHHNIIQGARGYAIGAHFDFAQVHNNIIDNAAVGIRSMYDYWGDDTGYSYHYKVAIYNNTVVNPTTGVAYIGLGRRWADWIDERVFLYLFNNIMDGCGNGPVNYCQEGAITAKLHCNSEARTVSYADAHISHNYMYRPDDPRLYRVDHTTYSSAEFEAQSVTPAPRVAYSADYNAANPLYLGTTGANRYRTRGAHEIRAGVTVINGGIGGAHPYLAGVSLPTYVGAVNPDDDGWVGGVLGLASVNTLRNSGSDEPAWVEGNAANDPPTTTISSPTGDPVYVSSSATESLQGSASDSDGTIVSVSWTCGSCTPNSGGASADDGAFDEGDELWTIDAIGLALGDNKITVTSTDDGGQVGIDVLTITRSDGAADAGIPTDAGISTDAGLPPGKSSDGCGCRTNGSAPGVPTFALLVVWALLGRRRRTAGRDGRTSDETLR